MSAIEKAVSWMLAVAADDSHGYDQGSRWGPDYDCSSLVISAWEAAGVPVKSKGGAGYTGNMAKAFLGCGFADVTANVNLTTGAGLVRGDVLLNVVSHTAMYIGGGQLVHAAGNENRKATGGVPGDQTGWEICVRSYYNSPWDAVLRYTAEGGTPEPVTPVTVRQISVPTLRRGDESEAVRAMQTLLLLRGGKILPKAGADGDFGSETRAAVLTFQTKAGLEVDGIVGPATWTKLILGGT